MYVWLHEAYDTTDSPVKSDKMAAAILYGEKILQNIPKYPTGNRDNADMVEKTEYKYLARKCSAESAFKKDIYDPYE